MAADRRAKFAALDQGLDPPPPKKEPKRFQQPDLKPANENRTAKQRAGMARTGNGYFSTLFTLLVSGQTRRELMLARQALAKKSLSEKQSGSRKARADKLRHIRDAQLATLSAAYDIQKDALDLRHAQEIKQQKQEWRDLSAERDRLWAEWREEFGIKERPRRQGDAGGAGDGDQGSAGDQGGGGKAPAPPIRKRPADQFANANKILAEKPKRAAASKVGQEFSPAAAPESDRPKAGWKQRKSAAERKLDGSYKPRQRKGLTPKM